MRIFLIGFPGSGKTFIGRQLAAKLSRRFLDLDEMIEDVAERSISEIFKKEGETFFRKLENNALRKTTEINQVIISCGGGTPCFHDNISIMKKAGVIVFLETPIPILMQRLKGEIGKRPLLKNEADLKSYIERTLEERLLFYHQADFVFHQKENQDAASELANYLKRF